VWNPFEVRAIPLVLQIYRLGYSPYRTRAERSVLRVPFRFVYRFLRIFGIETRISVSVHTSTGTRNLVADGRNLQYHSLYLPQHRTLYEPEVSAFIALLAPNSKEFWDVGANWGYHTLQLLLNPRFLGAIQAFEPNQAVAMELSEHLREVDFDAKAQVYPFGLGAEDAAKSLHFPDGIHSGLAKVTDDIDGQRVNIKRGDGLDLKPPDLVKIDVEGGELNCLIGFQEILRSAHPTLIVELWSSDVKSNSVYSMLVELGYRLFQPTFRIQRSPSDNAQQVSGYLVLQPLGPDFEEEKVNAVAVHPLGPHSGDLLTQ
jgi:FkbM family methyltransferase